MPLLAAALVLGGTAFAEDLTHALTVYGGFTVFNRPDSDSLVLVEFPFSLNRHEFEFYQPDSTSPARQARVFAQITLYGVDGLAVDSASTYFGVVAPSAEDAAQEGLKLLNSLAAALAPGVYSARLSVIDVVSKKQGEAFYDRLMVEPPAKDGPAIGGLCLAYNITYVGDSMKVPVNQLPKNGFNVRCNPLGLFSTEDTVMYLYGEIYNLSWAPDAPSNYRVSYTATTRAGLPVHQFGLAERPKAGPSAVLAEVFDIADLPSGYYDLWVVATDLADDRTDSLKIAFALMEPVTAEMLASASSEKFDPYDTLVLADQINIVQYLLDPVERKNLNQLDDAGKVAFLKRYWLERDSDPTTPEIENRLQVIERYAYANRNYSSDEDRGDGWRTDRGRVLIKYGIYDDLDDVLHPLEGNPFQVWHYYSLEHGAVFVFEDREGYGLYTLVHSNVPGEIYNSAWATRLKTDDTYRMD